MAFTENFSDFINPDTPGYVVAQILGGDVAGLFSNGFDLGVPGVGFESSAPELLCNDVDIAAVEHGAAVVINAVNYKVAELQPDGTGLTTLRLKK